MITKLIYLVIVVFPFLTGAQHTFSIVAVDTVTGMVGSAGASCLDTTNSYNINRINELVPGTGAITAQASWDFTNLANAKKRMIAGDSPEEILTWLKNNDSKNNPQRMQYGIVDLKDNHARSTAFSGTSAMDYKGHSIGSNYAVQGNVLIGHRTIDSIETAFLNEKASFTDQLMAALLGAAFAGADRRCLDEGVSSQSAYIRAAKPDDQNGDYYLDLYVGATAYGVEPIDKLKEKYDDWNATKNVSKDYRQKLFKSIVSQNQQNNVIIFSFTAVTPDKLEVTHFSGRKLFSIRNNRLKTVQLDLKHYANGCYITQFYKNGAKIGVRKIFLIK